MEQAQDVPAVLVDHIDRKGDGQPSLDKLLDILQTTLALFQESYIVLDGLDKCPEWAVRKFSRIVQIALRQDTSARVLATSRFDRNVEDAIRREQLEHSTRTELQWHNNFKVNVISREVVDKDIIKMIASSKHSHHKREIGDASKGM